MQLPTIQFPALIIFILVEEIINITGVGGRSKDLEGASVRDDKLAEARPRELLAPMPLVRFQAIELRDDAEKETKSDPNCYFMYSSRGNIC